VVAALLVQLVDHTAVVVVLLAVLLELLELLSLNIKVT